MADNEVSMMLSVVPGAMTGFAALNSGLVSINNIFMQTMARIDDNFGIIDASIIAAGALVGQFAKDSMDAFGQFEQGMKIVQMVSGQTAQDIQYLGQKANEFSVQYRTDIDQLTEGLQTLGRAGLNSASEQTEVLQNGLNTAKLEGRDLNGVLEELIQNTSLLGGNLKSSEFGEDSQYINDLLVATSMTAPITTHDISETLKYSGGIAAAAGAKIRDESGSENSEGKAILEDYMASIAAFAQKGVTGSIAGTALRAFLNKPATQDSSVVDALASIKLKPEYLWEEDEETMKPISEQIELITNQMDKLGVSTMDRLQIWSKIVGGKMGQQMMKLDSDDIKELKKDIQSADDATSLAQRSMQTYEANLKEIGEAGEVLKRNIGGNLVQVANPYLELITRIIEFMNTDFMSVPIAGTIIGFLGLVATKIKGVLSTLRAELGTIMTALKTGADMITARQLKGDRGTRQPLPGEKYTEADLKKEVTPGQLLKGFRQQFQAEAAKSLVGLTKENAAIVESSKGWSAESKYLNSFENAKYVSDDGKSFIQARDNQVIAQLARHNMLTPEIQKAFFMGTKKEEIMGTMLSNGATVREELESLFLQLQSELQKTATVLKEASVSAEEVSGAEEKKATTEKKTSQETGSAAERAAQQAKAGYESVINDFNAMWKGVNTAANEIKADTGATGQTIVMDAKIVADSIMLEFEKLAMGVSAFNSISTTKHVPGPLPGNMFYSQYGSPLDLAKNQMFYSKEGIPLTYSQNLALLFGGQYGNLNEVARKGFAPFTLSPGQMPWFMQFNTPADLFKNGPTQFNAPTDAEARAAAAANYHGAPAYPMSHPQYVDPATVLKQQEQALEQYKEDYIRTRIQTGKGVSASNYGALLRTTGIDYEALDKEAVARRNAALERSNAIAEEIKQELLTISNELTKQQTALAREKANAAQNQKDMRGLANAAAINAEKQAEEQMKKDAEKALKNAGTGYPTRMSTSSPDQVHSHDSLYPPTVASAYKEWYLSQQGANDALNEEAKKAVKSTNFAQSTEHGTKGVEDSYKEYYMNTIGKDGEIRDKKMREVLNSKAARGSPIANEENRSFFGRQRDRFASFFRASPPSPSQESQPGVWASFKGTLKDRWNQDRSGRFLNFGQGRIGGKVNGALNMLDAIGGPFMAAMIAIPMIMNYVQGIYEDYTQELKEIKETISSAYSDRRQAEDSLKQVYREQNPDAEEEAASDFVLEQYGAMYDSLRDNNNNFSKWIEMTSQASGLTKKYEMDEEKDDGSMKEVDEEEKTSEQQLTEAINQNNAALYEATAQLQVATNKLVGKIQDKMWGSDGLSSDFSDTLGKWQDTWFGFGEGSGSIESGFLKTASQKDENYAGDTELTGLMLEDFKDAHGGWRQGLRTIFGSDFDDITSTMNSKARGAMSSMAKFSNSLGAGKNARLQSSMMNDRKSWQMLAKEMAKYEKKTGKHAMTQETSNKRMENLIKKLQIDTHLNRAQVIAAAQLQQLQDMYQVAEQTFVPLMSDQAATAAQLYNTTAEGVLPQTGNAAGGAVGTEANSAAIAAYLSVMAQNAAVEAAYNEDLIAGNTSAGSKEEYLKEAAGTKLKVGTVFHRPQGMTDEEWKKSWGQFGIEDGQWVGLSTTIGGDVEKQKKIAHALEYQGDRIRNADWTDKEVSDYSKRIDRLIDQGMSFEEAMKRARENYAGAVQPLVESSYLASGVGEEDSGSGSGSGSGGGSGSGDKDSGTRKERVDLVLCSKKEIPKLNVNLFKKPPTFTVLNKNFKVRDVKINTEDTPKAIMSAIKNSFIDVQKRNDPKIIQDEEGVYNPSEATEGNPLPSGTAKTKTD